MIRGIGVDMVDHSKFSEQLSDVASSFVDRSFTSEERRAVTTRPARDKTHHLAVRYAAKEAFIKAWGAAHRGEPPRLRELDMREIEVINDAWGRPALKLHGRVKEAFLKEKNTPRIHLSLSHDGNYSAAFVVFEEVTPLHLREA